jgi:hypothetical protein
VSDKRCCFAQVEGGIDEPWRWERQTAVKLLFRDVGRHRPFVGRISALVFAREVAIFSCRA